MKNSLKISLTLVWSITKLLLSDKIILDSELIFYLDKYGFMVFETFSVLAPPTHLP